MRRALLLSAALGVLAGPAAPASAQEVEAQLQAMQARMAELEARLESNQDELAAANQRIEAQDQLIQNAQLDESAAGASSGLASFLETLEISGWVSGSYWYNFEDADGDSLAGFNRGAVLAMPFQPDPNSFSLDQVWFGLERPVSDENRAGFRTDIVFGKTAGLLSGDFGANDGFSGNDLELYQGYVQYRAPINEATTFKFGKFATLLGAEVVQSPLNFNISRGQVYNLFQPITHLGLLASTAIAGVDVSLGLVDETRSFPANDIDRNKDKAVLFGFGQTMETWRWSFAGVTGSADSGSLNDQPAGDRETILDLILGWTPNEQFSGYINADWIQTEISRVPNPAPPPTNLSVDQTVEGYGIAAAGRYAVTESTGAALRAEYVDLDEFFGDGTDLSLWTLTGTVDHSLTEQLVLKGELRYDKSVSSSPSDEVFFDSSATLSEDDQFLAGLEVIYNF
jgi:hypothetical protein